MKAFTIDAENNITVYASPAAVPATEGIDVFTSQVFLARLAIAWPGARLIEIWNSIPGVKPVNKFTNRAKGVSRIWAAIQTLAPAEAPAAEPAANAATRGKKTPKGARAKQIQSLVEDNGYSRKDAATLADAGFAEAPSTTRATRAKKAATAPASANGGPRQGSKLDQVIAMLQRQGGARLEDIMSAMGWQPHTARALMSAGGALTKKYGLTVTSTKEPDGRRFYSLPAAVTSGAR
jgi:hypothetical protein